MKGPPQRPEGCWGGRPCSPLLDFGRIDVPEDASVANTVGSRGCLSKVGRHGTLLGKRSARPLRGDLHRLLGLAAADGPLAAVLFRGPAQVLRWQVFLVPGPPEWVRTPEQWPGCETPEIVEPVRDLAGYHGGFDLAIVADAPLPPDWPSRWQPVRVSSRSRQPAPAVQWGVRADGAVERISHRDAAEAVAPPR